MYKDKRLAGFETATAAEVIEHLDPPRLAAFERVVFEHAKPNTVIITTPNSEYNVRFETLPAGQFRHKDHRFEWTRESLRQVLEHHDALRLCFHNQARGRIAPLGGELPFEHVPLEGSDADANRASVRRVLSKLNGKLQFTASPLVRIALFTNYGKMRSLFAIMIHQLLMDNLSWGILLDDLHSLYRQLRAGRPTGLPAKTDSFGLWASRVHTLAQSADVRSELDYWASFADGCPPLSKDHQSGINTASSECIVRVTLSRDETARIQGIVCRRLGVQINELLLASILHSIGVWTGYQTFRIDMVGRGRQLLSDDLDFSRTIGRFSITYPIHMKNLETRDPIALLYAVRGHLRGVPRGGAASGCFATPARIR